MKVEVGYITSWRRAIFFTLIISIILFGTASTVSTAYIGAGLISNIISVGVLVICIGSFVLVLADKWNRYSGIGTASVIDGVFSYNDRKRHFEIRLDNISKLDMENICIGREGGNPIAYRLMIGAGKKKYYIESDRAAGRAYNEVDLFRLYIMLQQNTQ